MANASALMAINLINNLKLAKLLKLVHKILLRFKFLLDFNASVMMGFILIRENAFNASRTLFLFQIDQNAFAKRAIFMILNGTNA